jgi:hypothetical protein
VSPIGKKQILIPSFSLSITSVQVKPNPSNFLKESCSCVKLNFHTPYCGWRLCAKFLDETGVKADVFWTGI